MPKKKKTVVFNEPEIVEGFVERNIDTPTSAGAAKRITIHTTKEGGIDWDKSQSGAADELLNAITNDSTMLDKIASSPEFQDETGGDSSKVTTDEAGMVLDVLTMLEGLVFSAAAKKVLGMKISKEIISQNFELTDKDHIRQDPLAAEGLTQLQDWLQLDPRWRWAALLTIAHGASLTRNIKACVMEQYKAGEDEPNPATRDNIHSVEKPN
jgi:hypothetical protein